ncbi:carotenoid oxygenase family protein [Lentzea sp. NPDC058450]|uniref:carotenoid oxygenase family protein n=1 Tax=Lentzea sp. NPDC058450 TaxID=3346505 RepID=UPI00365A2A59
MTTVDRPAYFDGFMAPVPDEIEAVELEVTGTLPPELTGRYFRNGPNPLPGSYPAHNFMGQGMLHGVRLENGRAGWYRNRWLRTPLLDGVRPDHVNPHGPNGVLRNNTANTSVLHHDGRILTLAENGFPTEVTGELGTVGPFDFGGMLKTAMTAHPKVDPVTGELHFFGYGVTPPFLTYHVATADSRIVHSAEIEMPAATMMHDFAITEHHVVWLDLPVVFDFELTRRPGFPYRWSEQHRPRIGVMPRHGRSQDVRWFDVQPGYTFHVGNAFEDALGRVVIDAVAYNAAGFNEVWTGVGGHPNLDTALSTAPSLGGSLYRWTLDLTTGAVSEHPLDDLPIEFPTVNDERTGLGTRYVYAVSNALPLDESRRLAVVKYDTTTGERTSHMLGQGWVPGEAEFVPAADGAGEDNGWLLSIVSHEAANTAELLVLDASDVTAGPVASVRLPRRVPWGYHGAWIADEA